MIYIQKVIYLKINIKISKNSNSEIFQNFLMQKKIIPFKEIIP